MTKCLLGVMNLLMAPIASQCTDRICTERVAVKYLPYVAVQNVYQRRCWTIAGSASLLHSIAKGKLRQALP